MFKRLESGIANAGPDPSWPADLEKLGYFIDANTDQIRKIEHPEQDFQFFMTNNDRHNLVHREAMHACVRDVVVERLTTCGIHPLYLPSLATVKPEGEAQIPIFAPVKEILRERERVVLVINDDFQDPAIWAYRSIMTDGGINAGSAVGFAQEMIRRSTDGLVEDCTTPVATRFREASTSEQPQGPMASGECPDGPVPGLIILNTGQLRYSHAKGEALTRMSWEVLPKPSLSHPPVPFDVEENVVSGHETAKVHIKSVFSQVVNNPDFVNPQAEIFIIAGSSGAHTLIELLEDEFESINRQIAALALIQPPRIKGNKVHSHVSHLVRNRTRSWVLDPQPKNTVLEAPLTAKAGVQVFDMNEEHHESDFQDGVGGEEQLMSPKTPSKTDWSARMKQSLKSCESKQAKYMYGLHKAGLGESAIDDSDDSTPGSPASKRNSGQSKSTMAIAAMLSSRAPSRFPSRAPSHTSSDASDENLNLSTKSPPKAQAVLKQPQPPAEPSHYQHAPIPAPLTVDLSEDTGPIWPVFSSGELYMEEMILPDVYKDILDFFDEVATEGLKYKNPQFEVVKMEEAGDVVSGHDSEITPKGARNDSVQSADKVLKEVPTLNETPSKPQALPTAGAEGLTTQMSRLGVKDAVRDHSRYSSSSSAGSGVKVEFAGAMVGAKTLQKAGLGHVVNERVAAMTKADGNENMSMKVGDGNIESGKETKKGADEVKSKKADAE